MKNITFSIELFEVLYKQNVRCYGWKLDVQCDYHDLKDFGRLYIFEYNVMYTNTKQL